MGRVLDMLRVGCVKTGNEYRAKRDVVVESRGVRKGSGPNGVGRMPRKKMPPNVMK